MEDKVLYALVGLWDKNGCKIIADYPADEDFTYRSIVLSTVDGIRSVVDDRISVDRDKYAVHILFSEYCYACLTLKAETTSSMIELGTRSQVFLQKLRSVYKELPMLRDLSKNLINRENLVDFSKPIQIITDHNHQNNSNQVIAKLEDELVEVRHALMTAVEKIVDRGQKLDDLVRKAEFLEISVRMASLLRFAINSAELQKAIKVRHDSAESSRRLHFIAARKIQAWFRGIATRNHLRKLHENATVLQRHWRGYRARMFVNRYLVERVHQMWQDYYNSMATRIQAVWRGYWTRKTQINVLQLRQWRKDVYAKNNETLENMKKYVRVYPLLALLMIHYILIDFGRGNSITQKTRLSKKRCTGSYSFCLK
ncbi:uncharacterized protein LOC105281322 [Ooceraea biroi]|uniref:uncharacterized protein LOC105281322 n=1 Tax=Ooceraea biroi TaxID=2015173 RepID=UPI000F07FCBD|nr:uncharacterized protein LOC105281322 [Ooceraea biroi]